MLDRSMSSPVAPRRRGALGNPPPRFERLAVVPDPDAEAPDPDLTATEYYRDASRSVISRNDSPDVPFEVSVNPYRGCEHGCIYCYARPTHEYFGLSAGLDFETRIFVKEDAPARLAAEIARPSWTPQVLVLSGVTDPYQPIERRLELTRRCLAVLAGARHPVSVITKSALVTRDIDLLADLAAHRAAAVALSVTTLDEDLRRRLEPRAAAADRRFDAMARLAEAGIPAGVSVAPVIPGLTDHEIPRILARAAEAGASFATYVLLRLPHGVKELFEQWLDAERPARRQKVLARIRETRGGRLNDSRFGSRMRGEGPGAALVAELFHRARARVGIPPGGPALATGAFRRPGPQGRLFD
jgi:DNA repair photolyase